MSSSSSPRMAVRSRSCAISGSSNSSALRYPAQDVDEGGEGGRHGRVRASDQRAVAEDGLQPADADFTEAAARQVFGDELLGKETGARAGEHQAARALHGDLPRRTRLLGQGGDDGVV